MAIRGQFRGHPESRGPPVPGGLWTRTRWLAPLYAAFATAWILLSDRALGVLAGDPERVLAWSVYKGVAFVAVTSLLLWFLVRRAFGAVESGWESAREQEEMGRRHQAEAERLGRLYAALSQVNQAIARISSEEELYQRVCRSLVEAGGFRTAWVGLHDEETGRIVPVAHAGADGEYIRTLDLSVDERPEGQGPSGITFRSGEPWICNDTLADGAMGLWRRAAERSGVGASATFPIRVLGAVRGVLNVYAGKPDSFQDREVALLGEAASDISSALDTLEGEKARKKAEAEAEAERRFSRTMMESTPGVLYMYTPDGQFIRWNHNLERVTGYSGEELAAMHPLELFPEEERERVGARIDQVFETGESFVEAPLLSRDGTETPFFLTGRRIVVGEEPCLIGVGIDISQRVRAEGKRRVAEEALRRLNESLERTVEERTEELQGALVRAEAADRIKSAFLAAMSHELRTPLNSIIGFTGIMLQELAGPLNPEQAKQLGMVRTSARHLLDLINDVLDLSKIEAGQFEVHSESFSLPELVDQVVAIVKPQADARGLELMVEVGPDVGTMVGDRRRVQQVLLNLVHNGVKFTEKGTVTVQAEQEGGLVRLRVIDTGIGIRAEDLALLFQPFRQVDSGLTRRHEGTGLGLAISRKLTRLMGGDVSARSEWSRGSEFCVTLPVEGSA